jgi:hypothetical protein
MTKREQVERAVQRALVGVPKTASADEVNLRLLLQGTADEVECSYGYFRACTRRILLARAKWAEWEGATDTHAIRPKRRRPMLALVVHGGGSAA